MSKSPSQNQLLAALSRDHFDVLKPLIQTIELPQNSILYEAGAPIEHVFFPSSGMLSLLAVMRNGRAIETATVGREGVVGAMAGLAPYKSFVRAVVQLPAVMSRIAAGKFRTAVSSHIAIRDMCLNYNEVLLSQARIIAACNAVHPINERFSRWLLQSAERAGSDTVSLTQELLAEMLGVRRTSVTEAARAMQSDGIILYSRGVIKILDWPRLKKASCECYQTLIDQSATLLPLSHRPI